MPPKKSPAKKDTGKELVGYNTDTLSFTDLKQYAHLLESEIEDMRWQVNFFQKVEDELGEQFIKNDGELRQNKDKILNKDVDMESLKLKFLKHIREKRRLPKYLEHDSMVKSEDMSSEISSLLEKEDNRHLEETKRLKLILQEKDRQIEAMRGKIEMSRKETKESNEISLKDMDLEQQNLLEQAISRCNREAKETQKVFEESKEAMRLESLESKIRAEKAFNNACQGFKQKLQDYYKKVTKEDIDNIKKVKTDIKNIKDKIRSSKERLADAVKENKRLKELTKSRPKAFVPSSLDQKYGSGHSKLTEACRMHNRIEKLTRENQNLEKQIKDVDDRCCNLRRHFTQALQRVRASLEMKANVLEEKSNSVSNEKERETASSPTVQGETTESSSVPESELPYTDKQEDH